MNKAKISYIAQSSIGMLIWIVLSLIVSVSVDSAMRLAWATKTSIWGFLFVLSIYFIYVRVRYYKKIDGSDFGSR